MWDNLNLVSRSCLGISNGSCRRIVFAIEKIGNNKSKDYTNVCVPLKLRTIVSLSFFSRCGTEQIIDRLLDVFISNIL